MITPYWNASGASVRVSVIALSLVIGGCAISNNQESQTPTTDGETVSEDIKSSNVPDGFGHFKFEVGESKLVDSNSRIQVLANILAYHGEARIHIHGHADASGLENGNLKLSEERVLAVYDALKEAGVEESQIQTDFSGESNPPCDNSTAEGRACNRSVVVFVKSD